MPKLRHLALATKDPEKTAEFYKTAFGFKEIRKVTSDIAHGYFLSDGTLNIAILNFTAYDQLGKGLDYVGLHHFGIWVEDIETMRRVIAANGGKNHSGPTAHVPENAEHKFRDPYGIVFDISTHGWDGAKRVEEG